MERLTELFDEYKYVILIVLFGVTALSCFFMFDAIREHGQKRRIFMEPLVINSSVPQVETNYVPGKEFYEAFATTKMPSNWSQFKTFDAEAAREKYKSWVEEGAQFNDESAQFELQYDITDANQALFDLSDQYYQVYWGSQRISPIYPLAVANVETGLRADHDITWSALFPSKYVPIEQLYTMDVTTVISDDSIYKALSKESSTRDRGALQMSPTYGTSSDYYNNQMSGTERAKLGAIEHSNYNTWVSGASELPGDRFYIPDVLLRLASANTDAIQRITQNEYKPRDDMMLIAMLSMYHHRSAIWSKQDRSTSCAEWKSRSLAYEYATLCSSADMIDAMKSHAMTHEDDFWISNDVSVEMFESTTGRKMSEFASKQLVCLYPIKVLYSYVKLSIMYS